MGLINAKTLTIRANEMPWNLIYLIMLIHMTISAISILFSCILQLIGKRFNWLPPQRALHCTTSKLDHPKALSSDITSIGYFYINENWVNGQGASI